ncbi:MAG TPA: MupA/Atu3671 family FMN-dependent luciferase-like monooxygenase [Pyrinomonadaceae bacterium]|nr:MupA/Atu3671 family FMN-dependent luciferase-like monooxygenase [Pyrinomonadaceae bacterium]
MKNVADVYHLTPVQREVLSDARGARVVQVRRKVHGELDSEPLERAWQQLLARHTMLRTCFLTQLEDPVQVVRQQVKLAYERYDCGDEPERAQAELEHLLQTDARREFDPARAPLFRVMEIRLGARLFEVVLSYHPVLLDERSVELIFEEVLSGRSEDAPAYRDYVVWVERQDTAGLEVFYKNQKRNTRSTPSPVLNLEALGPDGLEAFVRSMGVSVETLITGARALALMRDQESGEIFLDVTADKRPQALPGSEQIVGLLSNVLPLPITAPGEESLSEWLQEIERKRTKLQRYGHVSRTQIKDWLGRSDDAPLPEPDQSLEFSLFYFADDNAVYGEDKYRLYREGAMFADRNRLTAVWTPERHFHEKAGLYPNPSVLSGALATITKDVQLRAGSVVLPLHNSLRVAEEWSVVDNLSKGRVGLSFTSGWMPNDFAFFPERYATKREEMFRGIQEVQELWRGQSIPGRDGVGKEIELRIFPKPIQPELPIWLTCSGGPEMFEKAGELGCHVLTALLTQSIEEVTPKIKLYRDSLAKHGHDPRSRKVTMMMHTFIGEDADAVLQKVRAPLTKYLKSHLNLIETGAESLNLDVDVRDQDPEKYRDQMAAFAFERYYRTSSLIGTPTSCMKMVERLKSIGVDEVACLIDFGIDVDSVLESLEHLVVLRDLSNAAQLEESLLTSTAAHV